MQNSKTFVVVVVPYPVDQTSLHPGPNKANWTVSESPPWAEEQDFFF